MAIAYAAPLGLRTLSSSTRQPPNSLRTRSKPITGARTVPGRQAGGLGAPAGGLLDQLPAQHAVGQDPLGAVDVLQEQLDRPGPLDQPGGQSLPLVRADHPGHQVDREAPHLAVDPEAQAGRVHPAVAGPPALRQLVGRQLAEEADQVAVDRPGPVARPDRLVAGPVAVVPQGRHGRLRPAGRPVGLADHELARRR